MKLSAPLKVDAVTTMGSGQGCVRLHDVNIRVIRLFSSVPAHTKSQIRGLADGRAAPIHSNVVRVTGIEWHSYRELFVGESIILVVDVSAVGEYWGAFRLGWIAGWRKPGVYWMARLVKVELGIVVHKLHIEY
jgi:hypothetical protein